jgi:hypothetical protein
VGTVMISSSGASAAFTGFFFIGRPAWVFLANFLTNHLYLATGPGAFTAVKGGGFGVEFEGSGLGVLQVQCSNARAATPTAAVAASCAPSSSMPTSPCNPSLAVTTSMSPTKPSGPAPESGPTIPAGRSLQVSPYCRAFQLM